MNSLLHDLITNIADRNPSATALRYQGQALAYEDLAALIQRCATGFVHHGLGRQERVAVYLPKRFETVAAFFAASQAGAVFVPVNPLLKANQVLHILQDSGARILVTSRSRTTQLAAVLPQCHDLHTVVLVDGEESDEAHVGHVHVISWSALIDASDSVLSRRLIDHDIAAILYTSGSTGRPKGVVLSHRNMVAGASSVVQYLGNTNTDRLLGVLPFSFDYGFSQLSTAFTCGACVVLMDYLLPRDVIRQLADEKITGFAAVPPLWAQLAQQQWPEDAGLALRYITNSGGAMPVATLKALRKILPKTQIYLMYGLTEAFRSTYLPPEELDRRPDSMGRAIPNVEIMVVREDGEPCAPGEPGELVHRGALVAMGYWGDPEKTAERFRPAPGRDNRLSLPEVAVWSGDTVRMDEEGYLYFIGRRDDMIKTSGYRVSPTEIEEVLYATGLVEQAAVFGVPHSTLGQAIVAVIIPREDDGNLPDRLLCECRKQLPSFMVPAHICLRRALPLNVNGKIDRQSLARELPGLFLEESR